MALKGKAGARLALQLLAEPERFFSAIQVGITLIGVFNGALGALAYSSRLAEIVARVPELANFAHQISTALVVLGITYLSIIVGGYVPKTLALAPPSTSRWPPRPGSASSSGSPFPWCPFSDSPRGF